TARAMTACARAASSPPVASMASGLRAQTATRAPSAAKLRAMARPMPRDAPVTITRLPLRSMCIAVSLLSGLLLAAAGSVPACRAFAVLEALDQGRRPHAAGAADRLQAIARSPPFEF